MKHLRFPTGFEAVRSSPAETRLWRDQSPHGGGWFILITEPHVELDLRFKALAAAMPGATCHEVAEKLLPGNVGIRIFDDGTSTVHSLSRGDGDDEWHVKGSCWGERYEVTAEGDLQVFDQQGLVMVARAAPLFELAFRPPPPGSAFRWDSGSTNGSGRQV